MSKFEVEGFKNYSNIKEIIDGSSQKDVLQKIIKKHNISAKKLVKMTNKVNQVYLDNGLDPSSVIDFVITNLESDNPITSIGNWHIEM